MKLTVKDVYSLAEGLSLLLEQEFATETAFTIQRNHNKVIEEFNIAENLRKKLVDKYKEKDLENGNIKLKKDKAKDYSKEYKELLKQEVNVDLKTIRLDELGETAKPRTLGLLKKIIVTDD